MAVNRSNLGLAQGLMQGVERNRKIGLEDAERARRHKREDAIDARQEKADKRADTEHDQKTKLFDRQWQAMQASVQAEGADEFVRGLEAGIDPKILIERYNANGISKIKPETFRYDPKTGEVEYEEVDGDRYEGTLDEMKKLVDVFKGPKPDKPFTVGAGQALVKENDKGGFDEVYRNPGSKGGAGAKANFMEYLVNKGVAADHDEAYRMAHQAADNPAKFKRDYVLEQRKAQNAAFLKPGDPGYKDDAALMAEANELAELAAESGSEKQPAVQLPPKALKALQDAGGQPVKFRNGQVWQLGKDGKPVQVE